MCHHIYLKMHFIIPDPVKNQHLIRFFLFIKRSVFFYPLCQFFTSHYIYLPDSIYATLLLFFRPYEMCISGFKTIDQNILSGTETIGNCHKICPVCRFLNCHPPLQGVCSIISFHRTLSSITGLFSSVRTPPKSRLLHVAPYFAIRRAMFFV